MIAVIGFGGHARVVAEAIEASGGEVCGFLDDDGARAGDSWRGWRVIGRPTRDQVARLGVRSAVIAIGDPSARAVIATRLEGALEWASVVHPSAWISPSAQIGPGAMIMAGAIVQAEAKLGRHTIVNTGATIDHDCLVGDFAHLAPGSRLCGGVTIGTGSLLGTGAIVIPGIAIGEWSILGAGAVATKTIDPNSTAVGVPAQVVRSREPGWHL